MNKIKVILILGAIISLQTIASPLDYIKTLLPKTVTKPLVATGIMQEPEPTFCGIKKATIKKVAIKTLYAGEVMFGLAAFCESIMQYIAAKSFCINFDYTAATSNSHARLIMLFTWIAQAGWQEPGVSKYRYFLSSFFATTHEGISLGWPLAFIAHGLYGLMKKA